GAVCLIGRPVPGLGATSAAASAAAPPTLGAGLVLALRASPVGLTLCVPAVGLGLRAPDLGWFVNVPFLATLSGEDRVDQLVAAKPAVAVDRQLGSDCVKVGQRALVERRAIEY